MPALRGLASRIRATNAVSNLAERLTKLLVVLSVVASGAMTVLTAPAWPPLRYVVAFALVGGYVVARRWPGVTIRVLVASAYVVPGLQLLALGQARPSDLTVWLAALLGAILATADPWRWHLPATWRWLLVGWALVVAVGWPIVILREADFARAGFLDFSVPNSGLGVPLPAANLWTLHVAVTHGFGLLWFDWLFGRFRAGGRPRFEREILWPLGFGWILTSLVAVFQSTVDIGFLNLRHWATQRRASGALGDANPFGMLSALWGPAAVALSGTGTKIAWVAGAAGLALSWFGVWVSGSRSALLAGVFLLTAIAWAIWRTLALRSDRTRLMVAGGMLAVVITVLLLAAGTTTTGPVQRLLPTLPTASYTSMVDFLAEIWNRNGYGTVAARMFADSPVVGSGVGSFHTLVPDYAYVMDLGRLAPDNAQNWFRHELAELGLLGSAGWIAWLVLLVVVLWRPGIGSQALPAGLVKAVLVALALASLVGMPTQNTALLFTFWTLVFWCVLLVRPALVADDHAARLVPAAAWGLVGFGVLAYAAGLTLVSSQNLRVPFRARAADWNYGYGFHGPEEAPDGTEFRWTRRDASAVFAAEHRWLKLTVWVMHPDAAERPVDVTVWSDGELVLQTERRDDGRLTRYVPVPPRRRRVFVQTRVSRTWRPEDFGADDPRELGLAVHWSWVDQAPVDREALATRSHALGDRGVVEMAEQQIVQPIDVVIERRDDRSELCLGLFDASCAQRDPLEFRRVVDRRTGHDLDALESASLQNERQRFRRNGALVRQVVQVRSKKRRPACHVDGLDHTLRTRPQFVVGKFEESCEMSRCEMLDDLGGEQSAERSVRQLAKIAHSVGLCYVEASRPTGLDHFAVDVDASRFDSLLCEQVQELAAPAADIEHV